MFSEAWSGTGWRIQVGLRALLLFFKKVLGAIGPADGGQARPMGSTHVCLASNDKRPRVCQVWPRTGCRHRRQAKPAFPPPWRGALGI